MKVTWRVFDPIATTSRFGCDEVEPEKLQFSRDTYPSARFDQLVGEGVPLSLWYIEPRGKAERFLCLYLI